MISCFMNYCKNRHYSTGLTMNTVNEFENKLFNNPNKIWIELNWIISVIMTKLLVELLPSQEKQFAVRNMQSLI